MGNQKIYKPDPKSRTAGHRKLKIGRKASLSRQTSTDLDTILYNKRDDPQAQQQFQRR